jgi:hypothetical protein
MDTVYEILVLIYEFFIYGSYEAFVEFFSFAIQLFTQWMFEFYKMMLIFSWDIAKNIISDLSITQVISQMFSHFDSDILDVLMYFKVPDAFNVIVNAFVTKYVYSFLGGKTLF